MTDFDAQSLPALRLRPKEAWRLTQGHVWIYSNEVDTKATPLKGFTPGDQVRVEDHQGKPLGLAYVNPNSLICARLFSRNLNHPLNRSLLVHRLQVALSLREQAFDTPHYRLVYGDSDGLPGVVIDRYGDYYSVQLATAGMEAVKDELLAAMIKVLAPQGVLWKNNSSLRTMEGLEPYVELAYGEVPDWVSLTENGVRFEAPLMAGQKTGWFYDHREARQALTRYVRGKQVLDVFSYMGGWGVQMAAAGAAEVTCVDSSAIALEGVARNAALNGLGDKVMTVEGNAFEVMHALKTEGMQFDVVIIDPPAFMKRRKDHSNGLTAYRRLNELAIRLTRKGGILASCSCSMHLAREELVDVVRGAARHVDRSAQIFHHGHQAADHPVHPSIPETEYLKTVFARILANE